jgi:hypothetical protein
VAKAFGWLAALALALGAAGGASAATLPPMLALPLSAEALPPVGAPPSAGFQLSGSEGTGMPNQLPGPATLMLLSTGLAGLVVLSHREFA